MNRQADVKTIQEMLNRVPPGWGGPNPKLKEDGLNGSFTEAAIRYFQQVQLGTIGAADARVDPGQRTIGRLNHIWNTSETPSGGVNISVEPLDHVRQPSNMTCWAAAGTMLCAAKDQRCYEISTIMRRADQGDPGYAALPKGGYLAMFNNNIGLPPADTGRYTRALGLHVGPAASFTVRGWVDLMTRHGALGVVGLSPFLHIRVVSRMRGDGSVFGTFMTVHDPGKQQTYEEVFVTFAHRYESAAYVNFRMDQIWHR